MIINNHQITHLNNAKMKWKQTMTRLSTSCRIIYVTDTESKFEKTLSVTLIFFATTFPIVFIVVTIIIFPRFFEKRIKGTLMHI